MGNFMHDNNEEMLQQELGYLSYLTNKLVELDEMLVKQCDSPQRAYRLVMENARVQMSQEDWAGSIGMNTSQFKQCISLNPNIRKNMPPEAEEKLQRLAGNLAMRQWRDLYREGQLNCQRRPQDRIAQLEAELARERAREQAAIGQ